MAVSVIVAEVQPTRVARIKGIVDDDRTSPLWGSRQLEPSMRTGPATASEIYGRDGKGSPPTIRHPPTRGTAELTSNCW